MPCARVARRDWSATQPCAIGRALLAAVDLFDEEFPDPEVLAVLTSR